MSDKLTQLKSMTDVVADTGDIEAIRRFTPMDATTNPSLLLKAAALPHYQSLLVDARDRAKADGGGHAAELAACCDHFAVAVGREILSIVPGRVSTRLMLACPSTRRRRWRERSGSSRYTKNQALAAIGSSSKSHRPGKASAPPSNWKKRVSNVI